MEYDIFAFKPSHTNDFEPQLMQEDEWEMYQDMCKDGFEDWLADKRRTITLAIDDKTVAIMGVLPLPNKGGHLCLFLDKSVRGTELLLATHCVQGSIDGLRELGYEWVQTPVRLDFPQGERWARVLGFKRTDHEEDIMENGTLYRYWTMVL